MAKAVHWGILGTGHIARKFAEGLGYVKNARLDAVGSRQQSTANDFGNSFNIPRCYGSYEELANDPTIQAIYISTPNHLHMENSILCLEAGKAVLCEKPFALNIQQATKIIKVARENNCFIMEAMWTRFLPVFSTLKDMLKKGVIGAPEMLTANFGFKAVYNPTSRLFNPEYGGGALLDIGVYPISLSSMIFGNPAMIRALAHIGKTNVDEKIAVVLGHVNSRLSLLHASIRVQTDQEADILGSTGRIKIHAPWWHPTKMSVLIPGAKEQIIDLPYQGNGYNYEIAEVNKCVLAKKPESDIMPLDETLSIMDTLDKIREQIGLKFPSE
jgi:predicted dehydrogenase